ncbi:MAG: SAM-dependent methyltransferase [Verrucomicrobiaceae bacterium]|nr:SAM-dependent methyltransferase [Verrucomicrobiaceae bacterium]
MPSSPLQQVIRERILASPDRALSWAAVMELALYHPEHGYYGRGPLHLGRGGDFFTAVSVGPLYGRLLAGLAAKVWRALGAPEDFAIIEQGAHDGRLMEDVARGLDDMSCPLAARARFLIVESNDKYRAAQCARLSPVLGARLSWAATLDDLRRQPSCGFFMCNELPDAFPVHRIRWTGAEWVERVVTVDDDGFTFVWRDAPLLDACVEDEVVRLPPDLPPGYTTEVHPAAAAWMRQLGRAAFHGVALIADYGLEDHEYYSPARNDGTLRRYHDHKTDGNVLSRLGECDLTAHINFTRVMQEARASFEWSRCMDQGSCLTRLAADWLRGLDGRPPAPETAALLRQFHTLTHPAHMGGRFRMCISGRGLRKDDVLPG